jgi:hypothetical protein
MPTLHKNISAEVDIHNPKWFPNANNGDYAWKNELGVLESTDELVLPAALDFADASVAPPTTNLNDIYVLASGGSVNAGWGSVALDDWVRYDGTDWNSITPQKSTLCYDEDTDKLYAYDGTDWVLVGGDSIYTSSGTVPSAVVATLTNSIKFEGGKVIFEGSGTTSLTNSLEIYDGAGSPNLWVQAKDDATITLTRPSTATTGFLLNVDTSLSGTGSGGIYVDQGASDFGLQIEGDNNTVLRTSKSGSTNICSFGDVEGSYLCNVMNNGAALGGGDFVNFVSQQSGASFGGVALGYGADKGIIWGLDKPIKFWMSSGNFHWFDNDGSIHVGSGSQANGAALMEFTSTSRGVLLPRMTAAQAGAITAVNGLVLYVTSTDATFTAVGVWAYEAGAWVKL